MSDLQYARQIIGTQDLAFIVGNGINRYNNSTAISWIKMIADIWNEITKEKISDKDFCDMSLTELYDLIELHSIDSIELKRKIVEKTLLIKRTFIHSFLLAKFNELNVPVLTMNFDGLLEYGLEKRRLNKFHSDIYPWNEYYSCRELRNPLDGFGIWHINGMVLYKRSIRLGLSEYMKQVVKANSLIHKGFSIDNFNGKNTDNWNGMNTWLHIFFNKNLFIFGLALGKDEVFLRWLLIQREKYFKKFPERVKKSWFVCIKDEIKNSNKVFLENLNFKIITLDSYQEIYEKMFL